MERLCLDWANDNDLALARQGLINLAAAYSAAADAIEGSSMSC